MIDRSQSEAGPAPGGARASSPPQGGPTAAPHGGPPPDRGPTAAPHGGPPPRGEPTTAAHEAGAGAGAGAEAEAEARARAVITLLDPTSERAPAARALAPRPATLAGTTVGLLDIAKPRGDVFLDRLAELLAAEGVGVRRYRKPTFTRPAPTELRQTIAAECQLVVEGLAD